MPRRLWRSKTNALSERRSLMTRILHFACTLLALVPTTLLASSSLVLRAHRGAATIWTNEIKFEGTDHCRINAKKASDKLCAEIKKLLPTLDSKYRSANSHLPSPMDEPDYEFIYNSQKYPVLFQGPEICSIDREGIMICTKTRLSGPQKLLLLLRSNHSLKQ